MDLKLILLVSSICIIIQPFILGQENSTQHFKIGFSQCTSDDMWRQKMQKEMQYELALYPGLELVIKNAKDNSKKQIKDIEELINEGIDLLIVSPNESQPLTPTINALHKKGIPIIVIDRKISSENYTAFIGANNYLIGKEAGAYAVKLLSGKGKIAEIWGLKGSSPAIERHKGFYEIVSQYPDIKIVDSLSGEWDQNGGMEVMREIIDSKQDVDLVFAHNDFMALGAWQVYSEQKNGKDVYILGIDGLPGPEGGLEAVINKKLDATFLYPSGGDIAIGLAWKILNKIPFEKENILNTVVIDSTNANVIKIQTDQISILQNKINTSKNILVDQVKKYKSQRFWLIVASISLILVMLLIILLFRAYRNKNIANKRLDDQRLEVSKQNEELKKISAKLERVTQEKLIFYTNISHEFRTPLTLILGPLEKMINEGSYEKNTKDQLKIMHRNATRLLRLINQLMDLRKIENAKMKLKAGRYDIVKFLREIKESFEELADSKNINFNFISNLSEIYIYFDKDMIDKVLFNLLSNAFKFTNPKGTINIILNKDKHIFNEKEAEAIKIEVKDNGQGIAEKHLAKIFDRFYQGEQKNTAITEGTGIGLTLTKSLVQLHHGDILVESASGKGTSFFVFLQNGNNHLAKDDIIEAESDDYKTERIIKSLPDETDYTPQLGSNEELANNYQEFNDKISILIVEDEKDIRKYIKDSLSANYNTFEATNGKEALALIEENEPDLIITDVMMPEMDGLELTRRIKTDIKTCHIPVIMLSARASQEHKIEGLEGGADSYIPKPFNNKHLQVRVNKLIENRKRIQQHYRDNIAIDENIEGSLNKMDKNFIKKSISFIELNLSNSDFSVEELSLLLGLSRVHLYRKIKQLTGSTPSEFMTNIKLQKAANLMLETGKSISEIAYATGFSSPSYFSKCFKEQFNKSPKDFIATKR